MDVLGAFVGLLSLAIGIYFLAAAPALHARPRRGTALRLSTGGYRLLGAMFVLLGVLRFVSLFAG